MTPSILFMSEGPFIFTENIVLGCSTIDPSSTNGLIALLDSDGMPPLLEGELYMPSCLLTPLGDISSTSLSMVWPSFIIL